MLLKEQLAEGMIRDRTCQCRDRVTLALIPGQAVARCWLGGTREKVVQRKRKKSAVFDLLPSRKIGKSE